MWYDGFLIFCICRPLSTTQYTMVDSHGAVRLAMTCLLDLRQREATAKVGAHGRGMISSGFVFVRGMVENMPDYLVV